MALSPVIRKLLHKRVVLASASPRRREILSNAGLQFEVVPSKFKETLDKALFPSPYAYAMETAKQKALEVASRMHQKDLRTPDVVIGADTVVAVGELVLEKPVDKQDAYNMLSRLSGKEHSVFTGVAIVHCSSADQVLETQVLEFYEETRVKFSELSEELLWEYIHSGEPMDKAGGYGIQALGGMLVEYVRGDFLNVVGFPLNRFCKKLAELYCLPRAQDVRRATHDSIPPVDSFESRGDLAGGCAERAPRDAGPGAGEEARGPHSQGSPRGPLEAGADPPARDCKEADCIAALEALPPCPAGLLDLIDGFKASKALFTACKLRLFDFLKGREPQTAEAVAREVGASLCGTRRLLDVCAALRLLEKTRQGYRSTALADLYLASGGEWSLHGFIEYSDGHAWDLFAQLEQAVRGDPRRSRRAAEDKDCCYPGKHTTLQTLNATHGLCRLTARHLASTFDLSRFSSACHLGGCTDALAWELARQCPWLTVTVFDLPEVIKQVSSFQPPGGQAARVHFVPGDAFRDGLPAAELFVLPRVPQAWPEDRVQQLLRRAAAACAPGGGLLLVEAALDEERAASQGGLRQRLDLLLQPEGGTRSLGECRRLLEQHSFGDLQVAPAGLVPGAVLGTRVSR